MPAYDYEAMDGAGQTKKGVIAADSLRDARQKLLSNSLFPVNIKYGKDKTVLAFGKHSFSWQKSIKSKDLTLITRQLATMFSDGTPIEEAVHTLPSQSEKPVIRNVLTKSRALVSEGKKLSEPMKSESSTFPAL